MWTPRCEQVCGRPRTPGAELCTNTRLENWEWKGSAFELTTSDGTFSAGRLVITAGAWSGRILKALNLPSQSFESCSFGSSLNDLRHSSRMFSRYLHPAAVFSTGSRI